MKDNSVAEASVGWFPKLNREERTQVHAATSEGAEGGLDFVMMMIFSGALASLGLLQGSAAVVIGAMLVAPLMGPLWTAGLALVQGNPVSFGWALAVTGLGIGIGLTESAMFGAINPG